jgi:hypothetical protein
MEYAAPSDKLPLYRHRWFQLVGACAATLAIGYARGYSDGQDDTGFKTEVWQHGGLFEFNVSEPAYGEHGDAEPRVILAGHFACLPGDQLAHGFTIEQADGVYPNSVASLQQKQLQLCNTYGGADGGAARELTRQLAVAADGLRQ